LTFAIFYAEIKLLKICSSELKEAKLKKDNGQQFFQLERVKDETRQDFFVSAFPPLSAQWQASRLRSFAQHGNNGSERSSD
jgi:hypothetical protein